MGRDTTARPFRGTITTAVLSFSPPFSRRDSSTALFGRRDGIPRTRVRHRATGVLPSPPAIAESRRAPRRNRPTRASNPEAISRAERFIGFGDTQFRNQKYSDALDRYRKAVTAAPRLAEARWRQGYAQVALGHYEAAAKAFKLGLKADPTWPRSGFENDWLYGPNSRAKSTHLEAIAEAADKEPANGDLLFLIGVYLYFDGQVERAAPFFQRAAQLSPQDAAAIDLFLHKAGK